MTRTILLAGATGAIGRALLPRLHRRGYWVRSLSRRSNAAKTISDLCHDVVLADATRLREIRGVTEGIDIGVSCLGANVGLTWRERRSYWDVDRIANLNLLELACETKVRRFVYVSVFTTPHYADTRYVRAHEAFVQKLRASPLESTIIRPTGLFSAFDDIPKMAARGRVPVIANGAASTNPVDPFDVAELSMGLLESGPADVAIGGPDVLTRRAIVECAFASLGKHPRLISVPPWILRTSASLVRPLHPRLSELLEFAVRVSTTDVIAPAVGKRTLRAYFARGSESAPDEKPSPSKNGAARSNGATHH